jgi:N-hydroxyarylamine O-acetyltransferase
MISARAYVRDKNAFGNEFDHMALLVRLKKIYLVDVGFGDCFRSPLAMPDGMLKDISGFYRLTSDYDNGYQLQKIDADNWQPIYKFTETPRMLPDYEEMCFYHQTSPNTHFTQRSICTLATENGRISLSDSYLTVTEGNNKRKIPITSNAYYRKIMSEYFRINIEQVV